MSDTTIDAARRRLRNEYRRNCDPWTIGYSGGKDSSAVLKLAYATALADSKRSRPLQVIYCDTGVEIPIVRDFTLRTLRRLRVEAARQLVPLTVRVARPALDDRYFVKVIGRGYPPPSFLFRWCTNRLRIWPVERAMDALGPGHTVLLGIRARESSERDRVITRRRMNEQSYFLRGNSRASTIFAPILDLDVDDVWTVVSSQDPPHSIDSSALATLYRHASGECPTIRSTIGSACGVGRFGCWTCTVVRRDKAVASLIEHPQYLRLGPLLAFRNWLVDLKLDAAMREKRRRNGQRSPGPFTLEARAQILERLRVAEQQSGYSLLRRDEARRIAHYWRMDAARCV